ncbi:hypothetical protein LEMLEM_LOCUS5597, partial [Lemmus lemmus]
APARCCSRGAAASVHSSQTPGSGARRGPVSRPQDGVGWPCAASWRTRSHEPESAARIPCARDARPHGGTRGSDAGHPAHSPRSHRRIGPPTRAGPAISAPPDARQLAAAAPEESGTILSRGNNSRSCDSSSRSFRASEQKFQGVWRLGPAQGWYPGWCVTTGMLLEE